VNLKRAKLLIVSLVLILGVAITGLIIARYFLTNLIRVPQSGMANAIVPGDQIIVTRWCFGEMKRGTVVTFQYPQDPSKYVGRLVGLPGETIQIKDNRVLINGQPLSEKRTQAVEKDVHAGLEELSTEGEGPYQVFYTHAPEDRAEIDEAAPFGTAEPFKLDENSYFLLGDNRDNSEDSRYRGPVPRELIWGRVKTIYFSQHPVTKQVRTDRILKSVD
jgi:signal peptidase I